MIEPTAADRSPAWRIAGQVFARRTLRTGSAGPDAAQERLKSANRCADPSSKSRHIARRPSAVGEERTPGCGRGRADGKQAPQPLTKPDRKKPDGPSRAPESPIGPTTTSSPIVPRAAGRGVRRESRCRPGKSEEPRSEAGHRARESSPMISELLREGQEILVQVSKEPLGKKGARITSHIALPGRYLVYMPTVDHVGVSRKIASDEERSRLKRIIQRKPERPARRIHRAHGGRRPRRRRVHSGHPFPRKPVGGYPLEERKEVRAGLDPSRSESGAAHASRSADAGFPRHPARQRTGIRDRSGFRQQVSAGARQSREAAPEGHADLRRVRSQSSKSTRRCVRRCG